MSVCSARAMAGEGHALWPPETGQPKPLEKICLRIFHAGVTCFNKIPRCSLSQRALCRESDQELETLRSGSGAASKRMVTDKRWASSARRFRDELCGRRFCRSRDPRVSLSRALAFPACVLFLGCQGLVPCRKAHVYSAGGGARVFKDQFILVVCHQIPTSRGVN